MDALTLMDAPLIHIGYHKTATTWLQREFFARQVGIQMAPRERIVAALLAPGAFSFDPVHARTLLRAPSAQRLLISMEALSGYPHNGGLNGCLSRDMASRLQRTYPKAEILVTLRAQPEIIAAAYAQYVRCGGTWSAARYAGLVDPVRRPDKTPRFSLDHFEYLPLLRWYRELFGEQRLHVLLYEEFCDSPEAFLNRLAESVGLQMPAGRLAQTSRRNSSYRAALLPLARFLGRFSALDVYPKHYWIHVPGMYWLQRGLLESLHRGLPNRHGSDPRRIFGRALVERLRQRYAESNRRLAAEFRLPLEAYGYPGW